MPNLITYNMTPKEKAKELVEKFQYRQRGLVVTLDDAKQCALIAVENEYHSLREQLFNLRACGVIANEKTYLGRIDILNEEEQQVKTEINNL